MTIEETVRFVDLVEAELEVGRQPLELRPGDRLVLEWGSRPERRRLIAERHFEWARHGSAWRAADGS